MEYSFYDLIKENLDRLSIEEQLKLKNLLTNRFDSVSIRDKVIELLKTYGKLVAVKYYKEMTGANLREAKEYCDIVEVEEDLKPITNALKLGVIDIYNMYGYTRSQEYLAENGVYLSEVGVRTLISKLV